jgi:amino acid adenylation domain-containing protein
VREGQGLAQLMEKSQATIFQSTPSGWRLLLASGWQPSDAKLKGLCGGEALPQDLAEELRSQGIELWNMYGPTETTIWSAVKQLSSDVPTLGQPIADTQVHILDNELNPTPKGVAGELYISGAGLARGYAGRVDLTTAAFIASPFSNKGEQLYRTGDLVHWNNEGELVYLGRIDHQVKIRGFRIELGEIETALLSQESVHEAVVIAQEYQGNARLVAYVATKDEGEIDTQQIQIELALHLPDYMVPSIIIVLDKLPQTPNGKIDRKTLPEPEFVSNNEYSAPIGEVEIQLALIWCEVLGIEQVGRHDNFFELGGDSILSLQIVARMGQMGWKISPKQLFENQTVASLASVASYDDSLNAEMQLSTNKLADYLNQDTLQKLSIQEDDFEDVYPLTSMQEGMFFHSLEAPGEGLYIKQLSVEVKVLDAQRLISAWQTMVDRHVILRTSILWNNEIERPLQLVRTSVTAMVNQQDWRDSNSLTENLRNYEAEELKYNIDFFNEPLARLALIRLSEDSYQLIWTMHHLLIDGWSDSKLIAEWLQTYAGKALPPVAPGFGQYVRWLEQQDPVVIESYWRGSLSRLDGPTLLADAIVSNEDGSGYNKLYLNWSEQQTVNLKNFAKQTRVTLNTVIQAAWALLLKQYTGQQHVVFGATVAGRPHNLPRSEDIFGLFINTLPVIVEPKAECLIGDYLRELQGSNAEIREYEHTPLADIQRWAGNSGKALFDSIVVFENYPIDKTLSEHQDGELQFGNITGEGLTGYAMDLQVIIEQTLEIEFCFDRADFSDQFVMQLRQQMDLLLKQMINNEQMPVGELCLFERQALSKLQTAHAHTAHNKGVLLTSDSFVHQIFEQHANAQPDKTALMLDDKALTYAQLNAKANVLAHQLIARGVGPDTVVAVASLRSAELIIALLAVLKAGGAYVPLDPGNPNERLNYIIKDSGAVLILGQASVLSELTVSSQVEKLYLDELELDPLLLEQADVANPIVELHPDNLAYVVYTSGSTGKPKGVAVAHGPLTMHCQSTADIYEMKSDWRELIFMSFSFDGAHERWLTTYSVGATLVVRGEELWTAEQTLSALSHYQVTNTTFPPAYLAQLAEAARDVDDIHKLKVCVFGGEAMPKSVYDNVRAILQPDVLINGYGPTETVVTPLIWKASKEQSFDTAYAPIGKAVGQRWLYILDDNLQPVPEGVIGELYVGGQGIARGYLSQSSLTAQNFIADPFTELGERMYRTGDLVRQLRDENIEFLGRADHQVKIRGYRIELGEVESAIRHIDLVADVAVIDKEINDNKQLVAYIVAHEQLDDASFSRSVRRQLEQQLPSYMVPSHFVVMSALPRLISGKLDRHGLPDDIQVTSSDYVEPSTPQAKEVAKIWQQVLNIEQVGETDNFFELGGDSLLSLKVISKLRSLGIDALNFKLRDLMQRPTIGGLLGLDNKKSPLLLMNAQQEGKAALFCLHAGMGTLFDYQPLANQLQGQRTLYGVPCRTFADPSYKDVSLEQMALDYCQMIREKQGQGPYALFGWSLGATLAAMVAALLEAAGQQVEFLGLVDSFIPDIKGLSLDAWQEDFVDYISVVLPQISTVQVNLVLDNVYPGHKQALLPDTLLLEATIAGLLAGLLADLTTKSAIKSVNESGISDEQELGYAALGSEGLMETFMMARHLKELSCQSITLPKLKVTPHYWWVAGRPESDKKELLALFAQDISQDFVLDTDHFSIIRDQRLITEVDNLLTTEHNKPLKEVKTLA